MRDHNWGLTVVNLMICSVNAKSALLTRSWIVKCELNPSPLLLLCLTRFSNIPISLIKFIVLNINNIFKFQINSKIMMVLPACPSVIKMEIYPFYSRKCQVNHGFPIVPLHIVPQSPPRSPIFYKNSLKFPDVSWSFMRSWKNNVMYGRPQLYHSLQFQSSKNKMKPFQFTSPP